jgi:carbamoyl-phosphate synthase small subunit
MTDAKKNIVLNLCPPNKDAALILDDGSIFWGNGAGAKTSATGEVCFNTSLTGYQEILTDPSYAGQIITFTFPHIGNVGTNLEDNEALTPAVKGCIMSADISAPSNWRAGQPLDCWLKSHNIGAVTGIDTRHLTRRIRDVGFSNATIVNGLPEKIDTATALKEARDFNGLEGMDLAKEVSCKEPYIWNESVWSIKGGYGQQSHSKLHVVAIDFGAKLNILRCLAATGCKVTVVPAGTAAEDILALAPDGVFLSNGPGDPTATGAYAVRTIKILIEKNLPIFGICLGHQLLSLALGAKTKKMHHGHRGANHPVKDLETSKVEITSQNHGFVVKANSLPDGIVETHRSLFDGTLEGIKVIGKPIFSVQHHPEASPGPQDSNHLFDKFVKMMKV